MIGRLMRLIGSITFLGVSGVMGCSETSLPVTIEPIPTPTISPSQYWQEAADSFRSLKTVHFHLRHEVGATDIGNGILITDALGRVEFPDRFSFEATGGLRGLNIHMDIAITRIGERAFFRDPLSGIWRQVDIGILPFQFGALNKTMANILKLSKNIQFSGMEKIGGTTIYSLTGESDAATLRGLIPDVIDGGPIRVEMHMDIQDYRIKAIRFEGKLIESDSPDVIRILSFSDFDKPVIIEDPSG